MKKNIRYTLLVTLLLSVFSLSAASLNEKAKDNLLENLKNHFPEITQENVRETPIAGVFEIIQGPSVVYVSQDGRFVFSGDIIDLQDQFKNITENSRRQARVAALQALKNEQTINFIPENAKHIVTVFTDIDCGYCRKLHEDIAVLNKKGIGIRYLAFPRAGLESESFDKAQSVWCAKDPQEAITLAKQGKTVKSANCANGAVALDLQLGVMMGINGTPSMVLENGVIVPGYLTPDKLEAILNKLNEV